MFKLLHYLPIGTTLISVSFIVTLMRRAKLREYPPHLLWWAMGVLFYGLGTLLESIITLSGNTLLLNRLWYWAGAILGAYPLATGSVYLLHKRKLAHTLTAISMLVVIAGTIGVLFTPMIAENLNPDKPDGNVIAWTWIRFPVTPVINFYAAFFLIGGAIISSLRFFENPTMRRRAYGTALIALGAILPGIGGSLAKVGTDGQMSTGGLVEALYLSEFLGLILIWWGYELCVRAPKPTDIQIESSVAT
tara:strand:- start:38645 stop:39388 length:744 start_codon:yes stop_codon:yes gene_type:complete